MNARDLQVHRTELAAAEPADIEDGAIRFGADHEYSVVPAASVNQRRRAWAMVYTSYREKGYATPHADGLWYGPYDALPDTRTLLVTRAGVDVATLTIVFDSPLGLPADDIYKEDLDVLRRRGRRMCEITSLVNNEEKRAARMEILNQAFHAAYLLAHLIERATDFVITVNPHHAAFYQKKLFFEQQGNERSYEKVAGAPAVLLRLPLVGLAARYAHAYRAKPNSRSIYRFARDARQQARQAASLNQACRRLSRNEIIHWFCRRRRLFAETEPATRFHPCELHELQALA